MLVATIVVVHGTTSTLEVRGVHHQEVKHSISTTMHGTVVGMTTLSQS